MQPALETGGTMNFIRLVSTGLAVVLSAAQTVAACSSPDQVDRFVKDWKAKTPTAAMAAPIIGRPAAAPTMALT